MKKVKSPLKKNQNAYLSYSNNQQSGKLHSSRPIVTLFKTDHLQEHKRNANSIKKVLKQLTELKKQLKQIKTISRHQQSSQGLDMSVCRKRQAQTRKSSPSSTKKNKMQSHSSSRGKSHSNQKQISTQTKQIHANQINQFSFSIDSKTDKRRKRINERLIESEEDDENIFTNNTMGLKLGNKATKRIDRKASTELLNKQNFTQRIAMIEASEQYQKHMATLRNNLDIIQVSSSLFSVEDKLKLNIQLERLSKHVSRIPMFSPQHQQYYQSMQIYARNLNNQLNNLAIILNRCDDKNDRLRQKSMNVKQQLKEKIQIVTFCKNCEQNQKKGIQKSYRREIRKMEKEVNKSQLQIYYKMEQMNKLSLDNATLSNQIAHLKQQRQKDQEKQKEKSDKIQLLKEELVHMEQLVKEIQQQKNKEKTKNKLMEQDLKYYKIEIEKVKNNRYQIRGSQRDNKDQPLLYSKIEQLQTLIRELKQKQSLYQSIIKEKDALLQQQYNKSRQIQNNDKTNKNKREQEVSSDDSIDSAQYYKQKHQLQERNRQLQSQSLQIASLRENVKQLQKIKFQMNGQLQLCMAEIDKLHGQIDELSLANQKYKDKYIKNKVINQRKTKKEAQNNNRKGQALQQINQMIKHHREGIKKDNQ